MKPSTKAILILAAFLVTAAGWIAYSAIRGDQAMKAALEKLDAALAEKEAIAAANATLTASRDAKDVENAKQAATIGKLTATVAALKAGQAQEHEIAAAAVSEGADLQEAYLAGEPVVEAAEIPALTDWYLALGMRIAPLVESVAEWALRVELQGVHVAELEAENIDLTASNARMQGYIDADALTLSTQRMHIEAQGLELTGARQDVASAIGRARTGEMLAWVFGITTVGVGGAWLVVDVVAPWIKSILPIM